MLFASQSEGDPPFFDTPSVATLGPGGSSSHAAALQGVSEFLGKVEVQLFESFEQAALAVQQGKADLFVVPHAYSEISRFYMSPDFDLQFIFIFPTPIYGLATRPGEGIVWSENTLLVTHPAPLPLLKYLAPSKRFTVKTVRSTSEAAQIVHRGDADIALTNANAVGLYHLEWLDGAIYGPIKMSWSVFSRKGAFTSQKDRAIPHRPLMYTTCFAGF